MTMNVEEIRPNVKLSNANVAIRWNCSTPTYYDWIKYKRTRLYFLLLGAEVNSKRYSYPLVKSEDLQSVCNDRGFQIGEFCRAAEIYRNTLKDWSRNTGDIKRFWDLIEGYAVYIGSK